MVRSHVMMLIALVLGAGAVPAGLANDDAAHEAKPGFEVADGRVFMVRPGGPLDHEGEMRTFECSSASAQTYMVTGSDYCTTGWHRPHGYLAAGFSILQPGYTGTLTLVLASDGGEMRFRCSWNAGAWTGCQVLSSVWPRPGEGFCHDVWAHAVAGRVLPFVQNPDPQCAVPDLPVAFVTNTAADGTGQPSGDWDAYLVHA